MPHLHLHVDPQPIATPPYRATPARAPSLALPAARAVPIQALVTSCARVFLPLLFGMTTACGQEDKVASEKPEDAPWCSAVQASPLDERAQPRPGVESFAPWLGGDPGGLVLVIDEPLVLCGYTNDETQVPASIARQRVMTIFPGRYPLPAPVQKSLGQSPARHVTPALLQVALRDESGPIDLEVQHPLDLGASLGFWGSDLTGQTIADPNFLSVSAVGQELRDPAGDVWKLQIYWSRPKWDPAVDGREIHLKQGTEEDAMARSISLICDAARDYDGVCDAAGLPSHASTTAIEFFDCAFPWAPVRRWHFDYPGGVVTFDSQVQVDTRVAVDPLPDTILLRAQGVHEGVAWRQEGPFGLARGQSVLSGPNARVLGGVRFPQPIDGVCGLHAGIQVSAWNCDLATLAQWPFGPDNPTLETLPFDGSCQP